MLFLASKFIDIASSYVIVGLFKAHYYKFVNAEGIFGKKWKFKILGEKNMNKSPIWQEKNKNHFYSKIAAKPIWAFI